VPDIYSWLEDQRKKERMDAANNSALSGRNPADVARAQRLSKRFGIPSPLIEAEPEIFESQEAKQEAEMLFERQPWMAPFLASNPDSAAIFGRELPKIGSITQALGMGPAPKGVTLRDFATPSVGRLFPDVSKLPRRLLEAPKKRVSWRAKDYATRLPSAALGAFGEAVTRTAVGVVGAIEAATDAAGFNEETDAFFRSQQRIGEESLRNMRPEWMADTAVFGAIGANDIQSGVASTVQMLLPLPFGKAAILPTLVGSTAGEAYQRYQGRDASVGASLLGAGAEGSIEYVTEKGPLGWLTRHMGEGGVTGFIKNYVVKDIVGEQLATLGQDAVDTAIANPDKSWGDFWEERPQAAMSTLIATVTTSGLVSGGLAVMNRFNRQVDTVRDSVEAAHGQAILDEVMKGAENVEMRKAAPDEFARFVNEGAKNSPVKNVYIPVEAVDAVLADETIPDQEKAALTLYQSQIDEARLNSGEIVIPIGEAAAHLSGTKVWQSLREEARVLAGGISGREARENMEKLTQELESITTEAVEEAKQLSPQIQAKAAVYDEVKRQMLAAGRSTKEAQTSAVLLASRAENLASARYGRFKDAMQAWKWMQLQIVGPEAAKPKRGRKVAQSAFADLPNLLQRNDWAIMTAENPNAQQLPPEENAARMAELKQALDQMGLKYTEVRGRYGNDENSVAIEGITEEQARALGARFGQESVLTRSGLVYGDDTVNPAIGINILDRDAEDFFTELPGGTKFSVDIDFDRREPLSRSFNQSDLSALEQVASARGALDIAKSKQFGTIRDFKVALQDMVVATKVGNLRDRGRLIRLALADAREALAANRNAIGWYDEKLQQAMSVLSAIHPEIDTDENARFAFIYALAVTSTGLRVDQNFKLADKVYREYKRTGKMPLMGESNGSNAMKIAFKLYNQLTERMGIEGLRDFMTTEHTVSEIEKTIGVAVNGEHKGTRVMGAAFLGPKIGNGYFSNLYGNYDQLTMDRWFMRTWGRWTGSLIVNRPAAIKESRAKVQNLIRGLTTEQKRTVEQLLSDKRRPFKVRVGEPEAFARQVAIKSAKAEVRAGLEKINRRLRLDPKTYYMQLDGQKEAPLNAAERNEIRALMGPVLSELQRDNPELTMADLQAVLWYPEKRLYDTAKAGVGAVTSMEYENEEAPDYANAAIALAKSEGIAEDRINDAIEAANRRVAAAVRARRAGRRAEQARATRRAALPEDQDGFPAEEVLSSVADGQQDPMVLQQFGGTVGSFARLSVMTARYKALELEEQGRSPETIWTQTGWMRGPDGHWRFEISDDEAYVVEKPVSQPVVEEYMEADGGPYIRWRDGDIYEGTPLDQVLKHPTLFEFYPSLRDLAVYMVPMKKRDQGFFDFTRIVLNKDIDEQKMLSTLLHEVQHAIQLIEGFANGAAPVVEGLRELGLGDVLDAQIEYFSAMNRNEVPGWSFAGTLTDDQIVASAAYHVYERVAGEVEARNTQRRQLYDAAMRRHEFPEISADVKREQVLLPIRMDERLAAASTTPPEAPSPRGETSFFPSGRTVVQLFGKADFSTMLHEMSHVFLEQEFRLAREQGASEALKADVARLEKWFADHGHPVADGKIPVGAHELFARTGERYFREGNAPSAELRSAFKQFKEWLTGIYRSIKDLLAYGPAPINPEIREIFDRIIATDEAIAANATSPMSQEELGMTTAEYEAYLDSVQGARDEAYDRLLNRMMKAIRRRESDRMRSQRANVRAEVAEEVNSDPRFVALHLLRTGRWLNDPDREATPIKLHTGWLIDNYGEEVLRALPVGLQPIHRGDGVPGDVVAEMVGMPSGDALVQALLELKRQADQLKADGNPRPLRDQIIEDMTDEIMTQRHGDIAMSELEIEEEAIAALNANRQGEVLATELRQLRKKSAKPGVVTPYQLLREWARRKVNEGTVSEAISKQALQRYIRGYNKARNLFEEAILGGKSDEAIKQKQAQMINHALLAEGKVVADEINAIIRRMQRYAKTKALASIDQDYMDRIHELLEGYSFRNVSDRARAERASFEEWAARQREAGHEVYVPERFRDDRTNWKDAQVAKLLELNDMVSSLVAQGRLKQRLTTAREERELRAEIDDAESRILSLPPRRLPEASTGLENRPFRQRLRDAKTFAEYRQAVARLFTGAKAREMAAGLVKVEGLFDILDGTKDGTGPLNRNVIQPATDAANTFSRLLEEVMGPIIDRYKGMDKKQAARLRDFVTINELTLNVSIHEADQERLGQPLTIPRSKLLGLIANCGNLSNLSKLVGGERWGDPESATDLARVRDILVSYASKEDMDLVQDMWNGVAKLWPHIVRVERELSGIVPEEVVPMEIETPYGTYSGGYWPVVWDRTRSEMGKKQGEEAETSLQGVGFGIATPKGHTITRTGAMAPMEWSIESVLFGHLNKVISRVAYAPWIRDTLKLVDNPRITGAIRLRLGDEYVRAIKPWMRDQIPSNWHDAQGAAFWEKFLNATRVNMSIAVLGVSYSTGVAQMLGLGYSAGVLGEGSVKDGGKWVAAGILKTLQLQKAGLGGAQEFVFSRSEEMQRRFHEVNQESAEVFRRLRDHDSMYRKLQAAAFWHIGFIDLNMVAIPTWLGAYHKALSQGQTEQEAIDYAEKVVRLSQSSGRKKDLSAIQRGNAGQKFISMFYTPSSVFFNQQWEAVQHLKAGNWSNAIAPTFWFLVMTTIADAMRDGDWPDDDDDDGLGGVDIAEWVGRNLMFGLFYGIPVVRDAANAAERKVRGEYAEYGSTPLTFAATTIERGAKSAQKKIEGEDTEGRDVKNIAAALGFLFGLPGNQIGKTSGFLEDVRTGKVEPEGIGDWYTGATSGKLPEKQE
jgi:hypothetical protein